MNTETIVKVKKRVNPYTMIDSSIFLNTNISWKAKGLINNIEESTYQGYKLIFDVHIKPYFKENHPHIMLSDIKALHMQKYFDLQSQIWKTGW